MSADPILSVIIPCYNDGRFLPEAVQSAESNSRGFHEIIIVNDGSTDPATLEVLRDLEKRSHHVLHQENLGLGAARNRGIALARGRYILPLDSDNRLRPRYIDRGIEILETDASLDVAYGDPEYFGDKTGRNHVPDFDLPRLLSWNYIDACAVYRKSAWARCGGYDEQMPEQGFEDWDLWCRIACSGGGFLHLPEVLYDYRIRGDSMSSIMMQPERRAAVLAYIKGKKMEIRLGEYVDAYQSWDPLIEQMHHQPVRTVARLIAKSFFPKRYSGLKSRGHARDSSTRTP